MSLFSAAERFSSIDRSAVTFDDRRCLHTQDRFATCQACFDICPTSAIEPVKPPALDSRKCVNCLACIPACPVGAFGADDVVQDLLTCMTRTEDACVELLCEVNTYSEKGWAEESIGIRCRGCLAGLGAGALVTLAAMGQKNILIRMDACAGCAWGMLRTNLEKQVDHARLLLSAWGRSNMLTPVTTLENSYQRPLWDARNPPLSRRDLFRFAARQGQVALARALEQTDTDSGNQLGRDRRRISHAVTLLATSPTEKDPLLLGGIYAMLSVSNTCTACGVCGRGCPTGALQFVMDSEETTYQLTFSPSFCIGCELCAHICVPTAIAVDHAPSFHQVFGSKDAILLHEGALARCEQCKATYAAKPDTYVCPTCEYRRKNPFGSKLPPGLMISPRDRREEQS